MDDSAAKDQSAASGRSRLLRYPLRSATKSKEEKPSITDSSNSKSGAERGRPASSVSKSVGGLDISGKEKSAKPPRRFSVPSKSNASPASKSFGNTTPISEARAKLSSGYKGKSDTPVYDVSKSSHRKKFSVLSSPSYWLSQIKLSESAAKHSISLGFFKLALEARCEPIQKMSDELESYARRYNLSELEEHVKDLFESYRISESFEQSKVSGTCSQVSAGGHQLCDDEVRSSSSSVTDAEKLKPKLLDVNTAEIHQVKKANNATTQKADSGKQARRSVPRNAASAKSGSEVRGRSTQKKPQKQIKQESAQDKDKVKQEKKLASQEGPLNSPPEEALQENKENLPEPQVEGITLAEA